MRSRAELLEIMRSETHTLFGPAFLSEINAVFGVNLLTKNYTSDGSPKGLQEAPGKTLTGIACFDLATMLCDALDVKYASMLGRGFQVRVCVDAILAAGKADA